MVKFIRNPEGFTSIFLEKPKNDEKFFVFQNTLDLYLPGNGGDLNMDDSISASHPILYTTINNIGITTVKL